ncbi:MAG: hypothetical protein EA423_01975 [Phycisphaerales bacterium]|nr:MAG: hypothetical protein EA423_01975 [Phycisphaerales bacterium]
MARSRPKPASSKKKPNPLKGEGRKQPAPVAKSAGEGGAKSLLLRDIPADVLSVLKTRAERSGRSLQQELHAALRRDAKRNFDEARAISADWHERLADRGLPDSTELIREDRER